MLEKRRKFLLRTGEVKAGNNSKKTEKGEVGMAEGKKNKTKKQKTCEVEGESSGKNAPARSHFATHKKIVHLRMSGVIEKPI